MSTTGSERSRNFEAGRAQQLCEEIMPNPEVIERIRSEYMEMPGLSLTAHQVQRLCGIDRELCHDALGMLVADAFLQLRANGAYIRLTEGRSPLPRPAKAALAANYPLLLPARAESCREHRQAS